MRSSYFDKRSLNYKGQQANNTCRAVLSRIYFSTAMQVLYGFLILLCILSILLNFLIFDNLSGNFYSESRILETLEMTICILIVAEISLRMYLQGPSNWCSLVMSRILPIGKISKEEKPQKALELQNCS